MHDSAFFKDFIRIQKPVRRDQINTRMIRPAAEQRLKDTRGRTLSYGYTASDTDDIRNLGYRFTQKRIHHLIQMLSGGHMQIKQP